MNTAPIESLVLKIAERCNLNCSYCYMYAHEDQSYLTRPKFMSDRTFKTLLSRVAGYCDAHHPHQMYLHFHGGEPTLVRPARMERLTSFANEMLGERLAGISMQTNATLIDRRWIEMLRQNHIRVGVSLDGPSDVHDRHRIDHAGRGSHEATLRGLRMLQDAGLSPTVLCVLNFDTSGSKVYHYLRSMQVDRMNFLLPDVSHDNKDRLFGRYGPTPVADYLIPIFDDWFDEDNPSIKIQIFQHLLRTLLGGTPTGDVFGNPLMNYLIVESDGSIQTLDALKVCAEGIADSKLTVFDHGFDDLHDGLPLVHQLVHVGMPLAPKCQACAEKLWCGGGYLPHRYAKANGFDNPSVWCEDIKRLLAHIRAKLPNAHVA